jgi:hypothetical protein
MADLIERREVIIEDVLSGRTRVTPRMRITADQRLYYNYRFDPPSLEREIASNRERRSRGAVSKQLLGGLQCPRH